MAKVKPHVTRVLVCDPRKNALLKVGNKSDRIDSRKLAELLRSNLLRPVFHEDTGLRTLKELARSYLTITKDVTPVMQRLKAIYRSWLPTRAGRSGGGASDAARSFGKLQVSDEARGSPPVGQHGFEKWRLSKRKRRQKESSSW